MAALAAPALATVVGSIFAKKAADKSKAQPVKAEEPAAVLPSEQEQKIRARRRAAVRFGQQGGGRASTILSEPLGG